MRISQILQKAEKRTALLAGALIAALSVAFSIPALAADDVTSDDLAITGARWSSSDGEARWDKNSNAYKYEVKVYRNSSSRASKTTSDNYYDFSSYFTSSGDYHFEVRGVGQNGVYGDWTSSETIYVTSEEARDIRGGSSSGYQDVYHGPGVAYGGYYPYYYGDYYNYYYGPGTTSTGTGVTTYGVSETRGAVGTGTNHWCEDGNGRWYEFADGTYPRNCWELIDGLYYCFDENGYLRYGWIFYNNKWYYTGQDGALQANTTTPDGHYVGSDGTMVY